jgi:hypothetical protein
MAHISIFKKDTSHSYIHFHKPKFDFDYDSFIGKYCLTIGPDSDSNEGTHLPMTRKQLLYLSEKLRELADDPNFEIHG